jgi:hypothetical protein
MSLRVPSWSATELDVIRIGLGLVVIKTFSRIQFYRPTGKPAYPVGIARVVDLRWAASRSAVRGMQYGAYAAALCYAAELLVPVALVYLALATVIEVTFQSSHGSVNHGDHLLAVVLTAQAAAVVVWNAAERWNWDLGSVLGESQQATATWWAVQAIAAVYFTSGLSKLINTSARWIGRSPMLLLAAFGRIETDRMTGRPPSPQTSARSEALISWLFDRPVVAQCLFAIGLCVELAAPIGLLGETLLMCMGLALIALHRGNRLLLRLPFPEYQLLVFIYLVNVPRVLR